MDSTIFIKNSIESFFLTKLILIPNIKLTRFLRATRILIRGAYKISNAVNSDSLCHVYLQ